EHQGRAKGRARLGAQGGRRGGRAPAGMRGLTTMLPFLRYQIERRVTANGRLVARVAFAGTAGSGSEGNHHGAQMREVFEEAIGPDGPCGLIIAAEFAVP